MAWFLLPPTGAGTRGEPSEPMQSFCAFVSCPCPLQNETVGLAQDVPVLCGLGPLCQQGQSWGSGWESHSMSHLTAAGLRPGVLMDTQKAGTLIAWSKDGHPAMPSR